MPFVYSSLNGKSLFPDKNRTIERQRENIIDVEITVRSEAIETAKWIVTSTYRKQGWLLPSRQESIFDLSIEDLKNCQGNPAVYGALLGRALFHPEIATKILENVDSGAFGVRIQLIVEVPELKDLHWQWLALNTQSGIARFVASLPRVQLFQSLFSSLNNNPPCLDREHLNALAVVAVPEGIAAYPLAIVSELVDEITSELQDYSAHVLARVESSAELPTVQSIFTKVDTTQYAIITIIAIAKYTVS